MRRCVEIHPRHASRCELRYRHLGIHKARGSYWSTQYLTRDAIEIALMLLFLSPLIIVFCILVAEKT